MHTFLSILLNDFMLWWFHWFVKFVDLNGVSLYLSGKELILYEVFSLCMTSVIVYELFDQFILSLLLKTFLISAVRNKSPNLFFGLGVSVLSWRLENTAFSFDFLEAWMGVIFFELWKVVFFL